MRLRFARNCFSFLRSSHCSVAGGVVGGFQKVSESLFPYSTVVGSHSSQIASLQKIHPLV